MVPAMWWILACSAPVPLAPGDDVVPEAPGLGAHAMAAWPEDATFDTPNPPTPLALRPEGPVGGTEPLGGPTVIIGAGAAGLAAASRIPGPVVLLESDSAVGGRASTSGGYLFLVDTPELADLDRLVTAADAVSDWPVLTGAPASDATRAYLADGAAIRDHLVELGVTLELGHEDPVIHRYLQHHVVGGGPVLVDALARALPPWVDLRLETTVTGLVFDGARVVGVETDDGIVPAGRVIIASGGFVNRSDLVARFTRAPAGSWGVGTDTGARGAAFGWAQRYGLGIADPGAIGWNANVLGVPGADGTPLRINYSGQPPWIWVDRNGDRYIDESAGWSLTLAAQLALHSGTWAITTWELLVNGTDISDFGALTFARDSGVALRCADDIDDLAALIGLPAGVLDTTLSRVAGYQARTEVDPFGRPDSSFPAFHGAPCAVRPGKLAAKNYGGIVTDLDGRVMDRDGRPVPGLWAIGEAAGMGAPGLGGRYGFDGSLGAVVWSGWRTGGVVAAEAAEAADASERTRSGDDTGG